MLSVETVNGVFERAEKIYSPAEIYEAIDTVAQKMTSALHDKNPLLLCVLVGGIVPAGYLIDRLHFPLQIDYVHATRYQDKTVGTELHWVAKPRTELTNRTVVIIDDILDGGITLAEVVKWCNEQGAKEVLTMALVDKKAARAEGGLDTVDFTALTAPDKFLFGFGLDYKGYLRNAPGIYAVAKEDQ
ncbi:MAG: hypoxanthine-guanine phosphoribosyltransferase [Legionellales bacterium]|nr:hypoxanthine-guanine phosphoribosyltransferase [Legionellales bacterium]|tara:strand:- start:518 stop:1078 length:561 start_codon:yes stop_codon:yes gene_type:complete